MDFDWRISGKLGKRAKLEDFPNQKDIETPHHDLYEDYYGGGVDPIPDRDDLGDQNFDNYLNTEVLLPFGEVQQTSKVKLRNLDEHGNRMVRLHSNPILDTRVYDVELPDVTEKEFAANIIAQNIYSQCDADGDQYLLMDAITDHKKDQKAIEKSDAIVVVNGRPQQNKTTKGWFFCILCKDGITTRERLTDLKESNPVEVAEYVMAQHIDDEPAFKWWVGFTLKKRDMIISAVNKRTHKRTHKLGIHISRNAQEAHLIDK